IVALTAEFLSDDAVLGKVGLDHAAHHRFRRAVGLRHRIEIMGRALVVDAERRPEERQNGLTGGGRKAADEGGKIYDRHGGSLGYGAGAKHLAAPAYRSPANCARLTHRVPGPDRDYFVFESAGAKVCLMMTHPITISRAPG